MKLRALSVFVVMGDNGSNKVDFHYPDGRTLIGNKGTHKDGGLHVPLLMRAPGRIPAGTTYGGMVYVTDILPMLCDAAGVDIPNRDDLDGISFWSQATGKSKAEARDSITTWYIGNPMTLKLQRSTNSGCCVLGQMGRLQFRAIHGTIRIPRQRMRQRSI